MRLLFIFLFLTMIFLACKPSQSVDLPDMYEKYCVYNIEDERNTKRLVLLGNDKYLETGVLSKGRKHGPWIEYHEKARTPRLVANYERDSLYGPYHEYSEAGQLIFSANCKAGEFEGEARTYEDGVLVKIQHFLNGKLDGEIKTFYPVTSMRMISQQYKEGKLHGTSIYYDEDGNPTNEFIYENGEQISSRQISEDE